MKKELDPDSIFLGIMIGFIITSFIIFWHGNKNTVPCDTGYYPPIDSYQCEPDYMGGCN